MPPTTFTVTGTWYKADGTTFATGTITFAPVQARDISGNFVIADDTISVPLVNGAISQTLAQNVNGYVVTEEIDGTTAVIYTIPGDLAGPIDLHNYGPR